MSAARVAGLGYLNAAISSPRSTFLPRTLGVLMAIGGLGWLTFLSPRLAHYVSPYNYAPGIIAEGVLTVWLLVAGVNAERWNEQAAV